MHQNMFSARFRPESCWGVYDTPPDALVGWEGDTPSPYPSSLLTPLVLFG